MSDSVAVITDIHANLPALRAALGRIDELGIDRIYCGGDLVGYGPHPNEGCALIQERGIPTIYGNYDYGIARDLEDCGCAYVTPHDRELGQQSEQAYAFFNNNSTSEDPENPLGRVSQAATNARQLRRLLDMNRIPASGGKEGLA